MAAVEMVVEEAVEEARGPDRIAGAAKEEVEELIEPVVFLMTCPG